jgi:hypothetical protein
MEKRKFYSCPYRDSNSDTSVVQPDDYAIPATLEVKYNNVQLMT